MRRVLSWRSSLITLCVAPVAVAMMMATVFVTPVFGAGLPNSPTTTIHRHFSHAVYFPSRTEWAKLKRTHRRDGVFPAVQGSGDLTYGNGPVQHDPVSYLIFWGASWTGADTGTASIIENYFNDVGGTSFQNILTQYSDYNGYINNDHTVGGVWFDTSTPPTDTTCTGATVEDSSLQSEVANAISANSWPTDGSNAVYYVYLPNGDSLNDGTGACSAPTGGYCAYHNWSGSDGVAYGAMPYPGSGCQVSTSPNGNVAGDSEVNLTSHEQSEAITDPQPPSGWTDAAGYEIGDKCAWDFSAGLTYLNNGGTFEMQTEYSDATSSCVNSY